MNTIDTRQLDQDEVDVQELFKELRENCDEDPDFGITLVPVNEFTKYTENLIAECYPSSIVPNRLEDQWPYRHITYDYEAAAEELKEDYHEVTFRGVDYLAR
jgi:hypothetical protein